jgi:PadR family transcriptional regulator PadR
MKNGSKLLGSFEFVVMCSVVKAGEDAYGAKVYDIANKINPCIIGAVYTTLERLRVKGLVDWRVGAPGSTRGARRKFLYYLTAKGAKELNKSTKIFLNAIS